MLSTATSAYAETYRMNASYFVRSGNIVKNPVDDEDEMIRKRMPSFSNEASKIGVLHAGTEFNVKNSVELSNGAEALEIEITKISNKSHYNKSPSGTMWIYKGNDAHFSDVEVSPNATTEAQASVAPDKKCENCATDLQRETQSAKQNMNALKAAGNAMLAVQNQPQPSKPPEAVAQPQPQKATPLEPSYGGDIAAQIKNYSNSSEVAAALTWADRNRNGRSTRKCYRKVKLALAAKDKKGKSLIPSWYSEVPAREAKNSLQKYGFKNLLDTEPYKSQIKSPSQAPKGAVLVYSSNLTCPGTRIANCGHIEMKMDHGSNPGYISDYKSANAINETPRSLIAGSRYKLIGVMVKPMENP